MSGVFGECVLVYMFYVCLLVYMFYQCVDEWCIWCVFGLYVF